MSIDPRCVLAIAVLALGGCAEEEAPDNPVSGRTTPGQATSTPTPVTTPSPTATPTPTPTSEGGPEEQEGGAGDEEGIEQAARFTIGRAGALSPSEVEVTAFLPVRITLSNNSGGEARVDLSNLGEGEAVLAPGESRDVVLSGPRPGRHEIRTSGGGAGALVAVAGGAGG